jgi:hypothetical protein
MNVRGGLLERRSLLNVSTALSQERDDMPVNVIDMVSDLLKRVTVLDGVETIVHMNS